MPKDKPTDTRYVDYSQSMLLKAAEACGLSYDELTAEFEPADPQVVARQRAYLGEFKPLPGRTKPWINPVKDIVKSEIIREISVLARASTEISDARANWLEDVLAGLLAAGCARDDIDVQHHPAGRIVVCVKGEPKYECTLATTGK